MKTVKQSYRTFRRTIVWLFPIAFVMVLSGCGKRDAANPETAASSRKQLAPPETTSTNAQQSIAGDAAVSPQAEKEPDDRDSIVQQSTLLAEKGDLAGAAAKLRMLLIADPGDVEVTFRLATLMAVQGDLASGIDLLDAIPDEHPEAGIPALGQAADWCFQLNRFDEAEERYLKVLKQAPSAPEARRKLAFLLNRQGRRHEAAVHTRALCILGNIRQDELHTLIHLSDAIWDDPSVPADAEDEADKYFPIGPSGTARKQFSDQDYRGAMESLQESVADGSAKPAVIALYGRTAAEAQDDERFDWWLTKTTPEVREFSEYWAAIGARLVMKREFEQASRALMEAVDRDHTDMRSIGRLRSALEVIGKQDAADELTDRWRKLRDILFENNAIAEAESPNVDGIAKLVEMLLSIDRQLEAVMWKSMEAHYRKAPIELQKQLNAQRQQLVSARQAFPNQEQRLCGLDPADYPMPEIKIPENVKLSTPANPPDRMQVAPARLENVSSAVGINHTYQLAVDPPPNGFAIYQSVGGAVAAIDFDRDGRADLYFAQGAADSPDFIGKKSNQLFRNLGDRFTDVTEVSASIDPRYTTGVTAGDWNQDGFPDIAVGNIGSNSLFINNGDGTFSPSILDDGDIKTVLTTSLAMADLTGDQIPDIIELNYLDDPDIAAGPERNENGEVVQSVIVTDYDTAIERLISNDGQGNARFEKISETPSDARTSLGVIVADFDGQPGNEVFIANDGYSNQLWSPHQGRLGPTKQCWLDVQPATSAPRPPRWGSRLATLTTTERWICTSRTFKTNRSVSSSIAVASSRIVTNSSA